MSDMTYRQLGASGLTVSAVGLGCNQIGRKLDLDATRAVVDAAIDAGMTCSTQPISTAAIPVRPKSCLVKRSKVDVTASLSRRSSACRRRAPPCPRTRLGAPVATSALRSKDRCAGCAPITSISTRCTNPTSGRRSKKPSTALDEMVREGKVRYIGSSNFAGWQIIDADWTARASGGARFISAQNDYSLLDRDAEIEVVPAAEHVGVGLIPYYPLSRGLLTGKYRRGEAAPAGTRLATNATSLATPTGTHRGLQKFAERAGSACSTSRSVGSQRSPGWQASSSARPHLSRYSRTLER